jgi:hypothetical protein
MTIRQTMWLSGILPIYRVMFNRLRYPPPYHGFSIFDKPIC